MMKRILKAVGVGAGAGGGERVDSQRSPYPDGATLLIYNLLFCDRLELFRQNHKGVPALPWSILLAENPDLDAVAGVALDRAQESVVRLLAFNRLRAAHGEVKERELLGTILEVGLEEGLDTLAVYEDGSVRYINHSGKMAVVAGSPSNVDPEVQRILAVSRSIVDVIGPWDKERLPAPATGMIRMTFLVSDGLYFGQGPLEVMEKERMAAPLIDAATELLVKFER